VISLWLFSLLAKFEAPQAVCLVSASPQIFKAVLRIRMFLGLLDPDPDPLLQGTDPDPFINQAKIVRKTLTFCL
jgi:hypothetical protein